MDDRKGTHAGSLLESVNYVDERIEPEFPNVPTGIHTYSSGTLPGNVTV